MIDIRQRGDYRQSVLILGTAQLGMAYGIANRTGAPDDDAAAGILAAARDLGITHLDTARAYGDSENRIGVAAPPELAIITKVAPGADTAAAVRASVDASRAALGRSGMGRSGPVTLLFHRATDALAGGWDELRRFFLEEKPTGSASPCRARTSCSGRSTCPTSGTSSCHATSSTGAGCSRRPGPISW
ncbi:aldo/keto reductase [Paractinoplanes durhamensis]|uniref:aldo/keto reductase n=1 Tax=Paractinoplanes durhamensis TaxID=113563 RepID=UPI00363DDB50